MKHFIAVVECDNGAYSETLYIGVLAEDAESVAKRITEILNPDSETVLTFKSVQELTIEEILIGNRIKHRKARSQVQ